MSASLNEAAMAGKLEEVAMRLNLGEDINQKVWPRFSAPLHDATICGRTEVANLLIERGADVNLPDYRGLTPLKLARRYGQEDIEEMLMTRGAVLEATKDDEDEKKDNLKAIMVEPPWKRTRASRRDELAFGN